MSLPIVRREPIHHNPLCDDLSPLLDKLFRHRGINDKAQISNSLSGLIHYDQLLHIKAAANIIADAIQSKKMIMIIGDFDADGATSTALCMLSLHDMGHHNHQYLVPNRFDFGYGLSPEIVDMAHQRGAQVIITVDNGIACHEGVERANSLGIDVVITDHHLPSHSLPNAKAIVNPNQPKCTFPSKCIAGVGVAFYLMLALKTELTKRHWFKETNTASPNLAQYLDIVALGTVADVVTLDENNRKLVHQGLQRIRSGHARPGILALLEVANRSCTGLSSQDLGFVLGPRLNAAGRLNDMSLGIECLISNNKIQAKQIAFRLDEMNKERREIEASMQQDALALLGQIVLENKQSPAGIVVFDPSFHQGVIGILAGRLKEKFDKPTIVFAAQDDDVVKGSARSINGIHIRDVLEQIHSQNRGLILKFGGHAMAAGLTLEKSNLAEFTHAFHAHLDALCKDLPSHQRILSDGVLSGEEMTIGTALELKLAVPWGQGFEQPLFDGEFSLVSQRIVGEKHLKMVVKLAEQEIDAIAFNIDLASWPNKEVKKVHLIYSLDVNEFRGNKNIQLIVNAMEAVGGKS